MQIKQQKMLIWVELLSEVPSREIMEKNVILTAVDNKHFFTESKDCKKTTPAPQCEADKLSV